MNQNNYFLNVLIHFHFHFHFVVSSLQKNISVADQQMGWLLKAFGAITVLSFTIGIVTEWYFLAGIPFFLLMMYVTVVDFRTMFFLLLAVIPLSTELDLPGGYNTDLPTEPLMIGLTLVYILYVFQKGRKMSSAFVKHPITLLLILHLAWIFVTMVASKEVFISLKFFLAKMWYVTAFYFLAGSMLKEEKDLKRFFWWLIIPLCITIIYVLIRHAGEGFSFKAINKAVRPFYRNHVNYALLLAIITPIIWYARSWYQRGTKRWWQIVAATILILLGIQFAYTRAAYLGIIIAIGAYYIIKFRLVKMALGVASISILLLVAYFSINNNYLNHTPRFERTISHNHFDNLIAATAKGEDISTMERVHRWISAVYMVDAEPWLGFGPGNFARFYKSYTVTSFQTYVSDNEEGSGVHCYYLMVMADQGIPGGVIFLALCFFVLIKGEMIYHQTQNPRRKQIVMMMLLVIIIINAIILINDMLEADKVGPFFFMAIAVLVNMDLANKREAAENVSLGGGR